MAKSIGFGDLGRLQINLIGLTGQIVRDFVERLLQVNFEMISEGLLGLWFYWFLSQHWVPCLAQRRQGVLTQGPAQYPKCKMNISSFLRLPCLLDYLSIVIDQCYGNGRGRGQLVDNMMQVGDRKWIFSYSFSFFVLLHSHLSGPFIQITVA